jgi:hypothetical protein
MENLQLLIDALLNQRNVHLKMEVVSKIRYINQSHQDYLKKEKTQMLLSLLRHQVIIEVANEILKVP